MNSSPLLNFALVIVGDEILSGKRADKHLPKVIELLAERGCMLTWVTLVGDDRTRLTDALRTAFGSGDVVFCCGGIGATPDDHTRQAAAAALGVDLVLHPQAKALIEERMQEMAADQGVAFDPLHPDNQRRLNMGCFPAGAEIIPNPYNKIPGFSCAGEAAGAVHFVPGFPVMAWPMIEWVLEQKYRHLWNRKRLTERSVIVFGAQEATLTPLMERIEQRHPGIKVFSLPSVDHPTHGRHVELGVKGEDNLTTAAYAELLLGVQQAMLLTGSELVRTI